jgi:hypothetical protein
MAKGNLKVSPLFALIAPMMMKIKCVIATPKRRRYPIQKNARIMDATM